MTDLPPIRIAAAVILRGDGKTLVVRKQGTDCFMQPGGKIDAGETPRAALCRELHEELGLIVDPARPIPAGQHSAPAAHEPGRLVVADVFRLTIDQAVSPAAEIAEIRWIDPQNPGGLPLAELTRTQILPLIR